MDVNDYCVRVYRGGGGDERVKESRVDCVLRVNRSREYEWWKAKCMKYMAKKPAPPFFFLQGGRTAFKDDNVIKS